MKAFAWLLAGGSLVYLVAAPIFAQQQSGPATLENLLDRPERAPGTTADDGTAAPRCAVPYPAEVRQAQDLIRQAFEDDYKTAADNPEPLIQKLLAATGKTDEGSRKYAMLLEAEKAAALGGDHGRAMELIDARAREFEVDGIQERLDRLAEFLTPKTKKEPEALARLYECATETARRGMERGSFQQAEAATDMAASIARSLFMVGKSKKNDSLVADGENKQTQARALAKAIAGRANLIAGYQKSLETLKTMPDDPAANGAVGRYLCLAAGDWEKGLPFLAKGDQKNMSHAAAFELRATHEVQPDTKQLMDIANMWWETAAKVTADEDAAAAIVTRTRTLYAALEGQLDDPLDAQLASTRAATAASARIPTGKATGSATKENATRLQTVRQKLPRETVWQIGPADLAAAAKVGDGSWDWNASEGLVDVRSWSYGNPGLAVFGTAGDEWEHAGLQATMRNSGYSANGHQGLVVCATKEFGEGDGFHGSPAYLVRYRQGTVELLDAVPYHKAPRPPRQLASVAVEIAENANYTLCIEVRRGREIFVSVNGKALLKHACEKGLKGRLGLLAANGKYIFRDIRATALSP